MDVYNGLVIFGNNFIASAFSLVRLTWGCTMYQSLCDLIACQQYYYVEYNVIIPNRNDRQSYENKTQVIFSLISFPAAYAS